MNTSVRARLLSAAVVLCMLMASVAMLFSAYASGETIYQTPVAYVDGDEAMENLGKSVTIMDLNGDDVGDLVVGVPYASAYGLKDAGAVMIYMSSGGVPMSSLLVINGTTVEELFGWCVSNVSDVNGDGWSDLAIGAPNADPEERVDAGNVSILYGWSGFDGVANITINGETAGEMFGFSIAAAGDIMVDGMDDIVVGSPFHGSGAMTEAGRVNMFYGGNPMNNVSDRVFTGAAGYAHFGWAVAGGVNIDQDATVDMVVGAPDLAPAGAAYIYRNLDRANPTVSVVTGKATGDKFGSAVTIMTDLNGDTFGEVAVGAPFNDDKGTDAGSVAILLGGSKFNTAVDVTLWGSPNEWFGWSIASGGIHQDGYSDLLVGAPNSLLNATSVGRAYAYFGGSAWTGPNLTLVPDSGANFFGGCVAVGDNMTGDVASDFAVGDPLYNLPGLPNAGRVYLFAGERPVIPPIPQNPIVGGHVYVPGTATGLQGFTVTLESSNVTNNKQATTNAAGFYQMNVVPGTYWLNASRAGYITNSTYPLILVMDDDKTEDFYPLKIPVMTGTVRDAVSTDLIEVASVALYIGTTLVSVVTTPTNGTYWITLPSAYVPAEGTSASLTLKAWDQTHYTSSTDFTVSRNETKWVNFTLDRFPVVSGTVRDALDLSAVRGTVTANQGSTVVATTATDIRGVYTLIAVNASVPGRLYVNVSATGHWRTMDWVDVDKNSSSTLNFLLQRDNAKPASQLAALSQYTTTASVPITATASDANGIKEVQLWFRKAGSASYAMYVADPSDPYEFSFDSAAIGGDGIYEFYSLAVDWADNTEDFTGTNDSWTLVDSQAPTLAIDTPTEGQKVNSATVNVTWTGSDAGSGLAKCEVQLDVAGWVDKNLATAHSFTSVSDGPHSVSVRATDMAGLTTLKTVNMVVDTTSAASFANPLPTYTAAVEFTVTVTATDTNGIQETQLWYSHGGSGSYSYFGNDTTAPYAFVINTSTMDGDGLYAFYSLAIDGSGNNESTPAAGNDTWTTVDNAPPVLSIIWPTMDGVAGSSDVTVNWTCDDDASGVASYLARNDGGSWFDCGLAFSTTFTGLADGNHTVDVNATDNAGHSMIVSVSFNVDTVAPAVHITNPINGSGLSSYSITLEWSASDSGSGLAALRVSNDGTLWEILGISTTSHIFYGPSGIPEGSYTLFVEATDFGGLKTTDNVTVILDRTSPTLTITAPFQGEEVAESKVSVTWSTLDSGSGITNMRVSVDGGAFVSVGLATSYEALDLEDGDHEITVRVTDAAGNVIEKSVNFTVSTGGGTSTLMLAAIALIVIAVIVIAVLLMKRGKRPASPDKK